jgi:hypothetical protein
MADKSSENENKVYAMTLRYHAKAAEIIRKHGKSGRGEVHSPTSGDVSHNQIPFLKYCLHSQVAFLTLAGKLYCAESIDENAE